MNEYMVVYTAQNGEQFTVVYKADRIAEFKQYVKAEVARGYEFAIYQLVPVHTDWAEQFEEEGAVNA